MALFERSFDDLVAEMILDLSNETKITRVSPGSKARAILEILSRHLNYAYKVFDLNLARAFLSNASGTYLDLIGELMGVPRLGSRYASISANSQNIKFYVESGTFADINNNQNISLPAGTLISTQPDSGIFYKVLSGVVFPKEASEGFISAQALSSGESNNVGVNSLRYHNFTNYTDSRNSSLKVTNIASIQTGSDQESDDNYKYRISKSALANEAANQTSIILAALSVPGVANVVIQNRSKGIGTYRVLIKSVTPSVSTDLIDSVQGAIETVTAEGILAIADKPFETGMTFEIDVTYRSDVANNSKDLIDSQIKLAITNYVNNLDLGEEFVLNELTNIIFSASSGVKDIGSLGKPISEMCIYKESKLRDNKIRQEIVTNYIPQYDERLIIEPSIANAIVINRV